MYSEGDMEGIRTDILNFHENFLSDGPNHSSDDNWVLLKDFILQTMDRNIPSKFSRSRANQPWISPSLSAWLGKRQDCTMKQKRQMLFQTGIISSLSGKLCKRRSGLPIGPTLSVCSLIQRINRTRSFGDTIKVKRQDNTSGISPLTHNNKTVTDSQGKANILNSQFKSVFTTKDLDSLPQMGESPFPDVQNIQVSPEGICKLLKDINVTKATGPDLVPARIMKEWQKNYLLS